MIAIAIGAVLLWINLSNVLSFTGLALIGFAVAPLFPSLISITPERIGPAHIANAIGFQISAAVLGGATLSALTGVLVERISLEVIGPFILIAAVMQFVLYAASNAYRTPTIRLDRAGETSAK